MLMNDFGKTFVLAFYNSFLKMKLNCDQKNPNTCSFQKKMLSNLTKLAKLCKTCRNIPMAEFNVKEVII